MGQQSTDSPDSISIVPNAGLQNTQMVELEISFAHLLFAVNKSTFN